MTVPILFANLSGSIPLEYLDIDFAALDEFTQSGAGAVARTVQDKAREVVSIADFAGDDDTRFPAACAEVAARGGGVLHILPGTYTFSSLNSIALPDGVDVWGYGAVLNFSAASGYATRVATTGSIGSNVTLSANAAAGASTVQLSSVAGIVVGDVLRLSSDDLVPLADIGGSTTQKIGEWIVVKAISGSTITIEGYLQASYLTADNAVVAKLAGKRTTVRGLRVIGRGISGADTSTLEIGIGASYGRDVTVRDCQIEYCDYNGIRLDQCFGGLVENNTTIHGLRASPAHTSVIQYGIVILGTASGLTIRNNRCHSAKHGVVFSENPQPGVARDVLVDGNSIFGTWAAGIATHESNDRCFIHNNRVFGSQRGIDIRVANCSIKGNHLFGSATPASLDEGIYGQENVRDCEIAGNTVIGWRFGIRVVNGGSTANSTPKNLKITANTVDNIDQHAIVLEQVDNALGFTGNVIEGNTIREFGGDGIRINGEFVGTVIQGNTIHRDTAPAGYGVRLMGTNKTRVVRNDFTNMVPVRLENDTEGVPVAPRNAVLADNVWDHTTAFLSQAAGSQIVRQNNIELGNSTLTIAAGVITVPAGVRGIIVDTEGAAATDDLDTISGGDTNDLITLRTASSARDITFKDGTGNLALAGDFTADNIDDVLTLRYTGAVWAEVARSNNS